MKEKVLNELAQINQDNINRVGAGSANESPGAHSEFAMPFRTQLYEVTYRVFQQYWRTPSYIYNKLLLGVVSALFNGFSFYHANSSQQGIQNVIFSIFMITTIFSSLVHQIMPRFILQRDLYEVRERPSKVYSWKAFLIANIIVEIPYQILLGIMVFGSYFYPVYTGDGIPSGQRQGLILLLIVQFFVFNSTFTHLLIAALPDAETAGHIATLMFSMTLVFNGVFQPPQALPGFWIFMYRVSPLTCKSPRFLCVSNTDILTLFSLDFVSAFASTGLSGRRVQCSNNELATMQPAGGMTCGRYLQPYASVAGGSIYNSGATSNCNYCSISNTDQYLAGVGIYYRTRWRDYGIGFAYIFFNIFMTVLLYYLIRVRKGSGKTLAERFEPILKVFKRDPAKKVGKNEKETHAEGSTIPPYF